MRTTWNGLWDLDAQPSESRRFRDALSNDQLNLTVNLLHLQRSLDGAPESLHARAHEISDVLDALEVVIEHAEDPRFTRLFAPGAALAAYVRGLYIWCDGIIDALEEASDSAAARPNAATVRWRIVESSHFYFDGLVDPIRKDLDDSGVGEGVFKDHVEEMFWTASWMHKSIAQPSSS